MSLAAGDKLGPYQILALIGAGGMGEVYRAHDPRMGRDVAIKVSAEQFSERFDHEVRAVAALNHPHICQIYDVGPNFLVMEFVEGDSPKGPYPLEEALRYAKQIAEALAEAHEKSIIHRDLKPPNIKIRPDGTVKVLDFGLAKVAEPEAGTRSENSPTLTLGMTQMGVVLGTAAYMPPEQARGKRVDKRADIWAFGVVLFEMLTGKRLFEGESISDTLIEVATKEPDWEQTPVEVRRLLRRCLEKDPKKRLRDIGDVWELLESGTGLQPVVPANARWQPRLAIWASAVAVLAIALAAVLFIHLREIPAAQHVLRYTIPQPNGSIIHSFAVSPDGRMLVIAAQASGKRQLWLRPLDALQAQPMPSTDEASYPFWSPDSRYIGFFAQGKLRKIAASGGPSQALCDASDGRGGSWNRDDVIVFSPSFADNVIRRVAAAGGEPTDVIKTNVSSMFPSFLPDGRRFLYFATNVTDKNGIYVASLDGRENQRVLADNSDFVFVPPSPRSQVGHLLFLRENNLMAQPFDPRTAQLTGEVFPVAEGVSTNNAYMPVSASDNGLLLYWTGGGGGAVGTNQIVWYDRGGKTEETVGTTSNVLAPAISPDEKTIVFSRGTGANRDIWLRDLVRGNERRLTTDAFTNFSPYWSPYGDRIVYRSNRGGHPGDLYLRASNGSGMDELLLSTPNQKIINQWSRDGRFIVYEEQDPKTKWDLWYLSIGKTSDSKERKAMPFLHSEFNELYGQLSPDSRWMAYTSDVSGNREVYVQPFPAADDEIRISTAGGEQPRWSRDGTELFYLAADGKLTVVPITVAAGPKPSLRAGAPIALFDAHIAGTNAAYNYDVTGNGRRFLVITPAAASAAGGIAPINVRVNWNPESKR